MNAEPDIITSNISDREKIAKLIRIKGIGNVNADTFVSNIPNFLEFLRESELEYKLVAAAAATENIPQSAMESDVSELSEYKTDKSNPLYGKKIVMSKVRDKDIIAKITELNGELQNNITSETFAIIVASHDDISGKIKKAQEKNIPIFTSVEFKEKYDI
jgi:hypothetical protein